ncbi:glycerophosphoryl diester phosphodiesterase [Microbacterium endophyticum]|uniref:glycerophosphodiester phosphodiesterase n=1 Tax=Microbacterium endophyticum TaxID=1526412 RepID=A0A7W4V2H4_9MICO|nr:glycerophosphodiester phosphodiesterase family protein [Microbacterium endophyticum]MBB2975628.1 glycerophosphoryl diester phosphodiesterase [Microbacterium endophyticum]NIK35353.1 glycerophosphoryl diester phosphodiesterase [Microbacterium endophyticum]
MSHTPPLIIGHRGAPGYRPEHTRASYELAIELGAGAVEPDVVITRDGVLVVRHENEISTTTDVAERPEFSDRRTSKLIDGEEVTGWFTEDFTWEELSRLGARERLPELRPGSARFDRQQPILRLDELLALVDAASARSETQIGVVVELKHPTYFGSLGWNMAELVATELRDAGWAGGDRGLVIESFEQSVLNELKSAGLVATYVYLVEAKGAPFDLIARDGSKAAKYSAALSGAGLDRLASEVDGISLNKRLILAPDVLGHATGPSAVVSQARERGLKVFTWTCRPENTFLLRQYRRGSDAAAHGDWRSEWAVLKDAKLDGVFADQPDLAVSFFAS